MLPPPPKPKRTKTVGIRVSLVEYAELEQAARACDRTVADFVYWIVISRLPKLKRAIEDRQHPEAGNGFADHDHPE